MKVEKKNKTGFSNFHINTGYNRSQSISIQIENDMGFLKCLKFVLILGFFVESQTHVIKRRDTNGLGNYRNLPEELRTPQKYIIRPMQTYTKNSEDGIVTPYDTVDFDTEDGYNEIKNKVQLTQHRVGFRSGDVGGKLQEKPTETNVKRILELDVSGNEIKTEVVDEVVESKIGEDSGDASISVNERVLKRVLATNEDDTVNDVSGIIQNFVDKTLVDITNSEKEVEDKEVKSLKTNAISKNKNNIEVTGTKSNYPTPGSGITQNFGKSLKDYEEFLDNGKGSESKLSETETISKHNDDATKKFNFEDQNLTSNSNISSTIVKSSADSIVPKETVPETEAKKPETESNSKVVQEIEVQSQETNLEDEKGIQTLDPRQVLGRNIKDPEDLTESEKEPEKSEETPTKVPGSLGKDPINGTTFVASEADEENATAIESENGMQISKDDELEIALHSGEEMQTEATDLALELDTTLPQDNINAYSEAFVSNMEDIAELSKSPLLITTESSFPNDKDLPGNTNDNSGLLPETAGEITQTTKESNIETLDNLAHDPTIIDNVKEMDNDDGESLSTLPERDLETSQNSEKLQENTAPKGSENISLTLETVEALELNETLEDLRETLVGTIDELDILAQTPITTDNIEETSIDDSEILPLLTENDLESSQDFEKVQENTAANGSDGNPLIVESSSTLEVNETSEDLIENLVETTDEPDNLTQSPTITDNNMEIRNDDAEILPILTETDLETSQDSTVQEIDVKSPSVPLENDVKTSQDSEKIEENTAAKGSDSNPVIVETSSTSEVNETSEAETTNEALIQSEFTKPQEILKDSVANDVPDVTNVATDLEPIKSIPEPKLETSEIINENTGMTSDEINKEAEFTSTIRTPLEALQTVTKPDNLIQDSSGSSSSVTPSADTSPNQLINETVASPSVTTTTILEPTQNTEANKPKPSLSEISQAETKPTDLIRESVVSAPITGPSKPIHKPETNKPKDTILSRTTSKPKIQQTSLNPTKTINSSGNTNNTITKSKPDLTNQANPVQGAAKPNRKPLTTPKPVRVVSINRISTMNPIRGKPIPPATPPTKKVNRRTTTAPHTIAVTTSNQINKQKPSTPKPVANKPLANSPLPTRRPGHHKWFSNFHNFGGQSTPFFPAVFVNPFSNRITTTRNQTQDTFGVGLFAVPWNWRPFNFTRLNFFTPNRVIETPAPPKSDTQKQEDLGRDLAVWNDIFQRSSTNANGGLFEQSAESKWNSTTENSRRINATTTASLNNSTLEVTSSGRGSGSSSRDSGGENTPSPPVTASTGTNPTGRQRQQRFVATLNCINGSSNVNNVEDENDDNDQFIVNRQQQQHQQQLEEQQHQRQRPILCRTPPPNYHSLAVTPPPSYTPRQQIQTSPANSRAEDVAAPHQQHHQPRQHSHSHPPSALRRCQIPEVLGLGIDDYNVDAQLNGLNIVERQQRLRATARATPDQANADAEAVVVNAPNRRQVLVANGRFHQPTRNVATVSQQQRRRKQRRRKLHLLQQQQQHQQQQHYNHHQQHLPIVNGSTSDSDSSSSLSDISPDSNELAIGGTTRDQRRRRRQRLLKLRDAYCPDLLNACSLILLQQQTSDSTVGSFTDTPPELVHDSSDYVEITEYQRNRQRLQNAQSTPEIHRHHHRHDQNRLNGVEERRQATRERAASEAEENQRLQNFKQEMGQNLSIRRPRISLTWVLREQQQQQQQQPNEPEAGKTEGENKENQKETQGNKTIDPQRLTNNNQVNGKVARNQEAKNQNSGVVEKKKYRLKQIPGSTEPLNGYATTPTSYTNASTALGSQKFFSNQNLLEYHKDDAGTKPPSKDLLFVCTPQRVPDGFGGSSEALALAKKRNEIRKKLAAKMAQFRSENQATRLVTNISTHLNGGVVSLKRESKSSLKSGSYSEPSLIAASEGNSRRHRHRKRRERNRPPKFGYDIKNVDEFLTKCSLASPANIPMVLSTSCILYQTRPGGYQTEISLPLGMVVNAVFKNQNWLYVQTPHAEEGYVNYTTCLPLGILPPEARKEGKPEAKSKPCWDTNGDVFPKPCGNMTDSEKEIHLRVGTRSEGARTPRLKSQLTDNETATVISAKTDKTDCINGNTSSIYGEQQVDKLYLRAASQPKLAEKACYAQLKIIRNHSSAASATSSKSQINDEYVTLQQKGMQKHVHHIPAQKTYISRTFITNGHNGQHLHPKDMKNLQHQQQIQAAANNCNNLKNPTATKQQQQLDNATTTITVTSYPPTHQIQSPQQQQQLHHHPTQPHRHHHHQQQQSLPSSTSLHHINNQSSMTAATTTATTTTVAPRSILNAIRRSSAHCGQRQTLVAITTDYSTGDGLTLQKGDIVTLCECRETKDHRQWFYVRTRDGRQGYIPAEVAGHGYL